MTVDDLALQLQVLQSRGYGKLHVHVCGTLSEEVDDAMLHTDIDEEVRQVKLASYNNDTMQLVELVIGES